MKERKKEIALFHKKYINIFYIDKLTISIIKKDKNI